MPRNKRPRAQRKKWRKKPRHFQIFSTMYLHGRFLGDCWHRTGTHNLSSDSTIGDLKDSIVAQFGPYPFQIMFGDQRLDLDMSKCVDTFGFQDNATIELVPASPNHLDRWITHFTGKINELRLEITEPKIGEEIVPSFNTWCNSRSGYFRTAILIFGSNFEAEEKRAQNQIEAWMLVRDTRIKILVRKVRNLLQQHITTDPICEIVLGFLV